MNTYLFSNRIYEIYIRSFYDSNGDGIGDIPGVTAKLDYLRELGINTIWLTPVFESPNYDFGYDVSDYYKINPEFGTMEDLVELLKQAHRRGIRVLLDLVLNHCSFKHPWFSEAINDPNSKYRDYFIFKSEIPNNLGCQFGSSAWHLAGNGEYYLGLFSEYQPDFNWRNPELRKELLGIVEHYLKLGVDGFRFDVLSLIQKPEEFEHIESEREYADFKSYANSPGIEGYLQELSELLGRYNAVSIGEGSGLSGAEGVDLCKYISYMLTFDLMNLDNSESFKWNHDSFDLRKLKVTLEANQRLYSGTQGGVLFIENHDQPRIVSRIATPIYYERAAKAMASLLYCLKGVPLIYQGQELGMTNAIFEIEDITDIESLNAYHMSKDKEDALAIINKKSRNHVRTPVQWSAEKNAGFSSGVPWTKINPNYTAINAEEQRKNPESVFNHYRRVLHLRNQIKGEAEFLELPFPLIAYRRGDYMVIGNIAEEETELRQDISAYEVILNNASTLGKTLLPWQTLILKRRN